MNERDIRGLFADQERQIVTQSFFHRPAHDVVRELSERVYIRGDDPVRFPFGNAKVLPIDIGEGLRDYKITLAEAYSEEDVVAVGQKGRLPILQGMISGEVIAFPYRSARLSFIKTINGENILIREIEDLATGKRTRTATEVTNILGLSQESWGKLTLLEDGMLHFTQIPARKKVTNGDNETQGNQEGQEEPNMNAIVQSMIEELKGEEE